MANKTSLTYSMLLMYYLITSQETNKPRSNVTMLTVTHDHTGITNQFIPINSPQSLVDAK